MPLYKDSLAAKPAAVALDGTETWWMLQGGVSVEGTALQVKDYVQEALGISAFALTLLDDTGASAALTTLGVSAFAKTILDDADAAAVRATLGLTLGTSGATVPLLNGANTWSGVQTFATDATFSNPSLGGGVFATLNFIAEASNGVIEPILTFNRAGANVLALKNTHAGGYSALTFRDNNNNEHGAIGYGNASSSGPYSNRCYWEISSLNGVSAPPDAIVVQTGIITNYSPSPSVYTRQLFQNDGAIIFYGGTTGNNVVLQLGPLYGSSFYGPLTVNNSTPNARSLIVAAGTVTSGAPHALDISQTWNVLDQHIAFKMNVVDTLSGDQSLLMMLQVGGAMKHGVQKSGFMNLGAMTSAAPAIKPISTAIHFRLGDDSAFAPISALTGTFSTHVIAPLLYNGVGFSTIQLGGATYGTGGLLAVRDNGVTVVRNAGSFSWTNGDDPTGGSIDTTLTREAANFIGSTGSLRLMNATSIPAGGTAGAGLKLSSTANFGLFFGSGAPSLAAAKGSLYLRSDGSGTGDRAYINTDGSTAWTALTTAT